MEAGYEIVETNLKEGILTFRKKDWI